MLYSSRVALPLQAIFWATGEKEGREVHTVTATLEPVRPDALQFSFHRRNLSLTLSAGSSHDALGLQLFPDPLPLTDIVRDVGDN